MWAEIDAACHEFDMAARVWEHSLEIAQRVARRAGLVIDVLAVEPFLRLIVRVDLLARVLAAYHRLLATRVAGEGHGILLEVAGGVEWHVPLPDRVARVSSVVECHLCPPGECAQHGGS